MSDQIVTIAEIERRARAAYFARLPITACPFNWHSAAYETWCAEFRRMKPTKASPQSHIAPAPVLRVDEAQTC